MTAAVEAGGENVARLKSRLRRSEAAMGALVRMGLNGATVERLHLGLREPYRSRIDGVEVRDAVCFPLLGEGGRPLGRYAYLNLPGVTANPLREDAWGPGPPQVYRLGSFAPDAVALVSAAVVDCWLAWQVSRGGHPEVAFLTRSHAEGWPPEWRHPAFWARFARVVVLPGAGTDDFMLDIAHRIDRSVELVQLPAAFAGMGALAAAADRPSLDDLLSSARPCAPEAPAPAASLPPDAVGRFEAAPVEVTGAYAGGFSYYAFSVERRAIERGARGGEGVLVQSYETLVLRSDGRLLTTERLPAPRGTPADQRVLALSDGTRIRGEPPVGAGGTWSFASIQSFVAWRTAGGDAPFRPLAELLADIEARLRDRVWLPVDGQYTVCAAYVALSHCYRVFDAIPVLLVTGGRATGKSELGEALASMSFHATVASQMRAAGLIRLLDETRGLVVMDDMDGGGANAVSGAGELVQAIKSGYKQATARKPIADRGGRIRMVDFFSPKVVTNTKSVDAIVGSRVLCVRTAAVPASVPLWDGSPDEAAISSLRDELHCWGLAAVGELAQAYRGLADRRRDRRAEIAAPLRAIALVAGDARLSGRLEAALTDPLIDPATPFPAI